MSQTTAISEPPCFTPNPDGPVTADHSVPFHRARLLTVVVAPARGNIPPTYRSPLYTASADTKPSGRIVTPGTPDEPISGSQSVPSQVAMPLTTSPPASTNEPPTTSLPLYMTIAWTDESAPSPLGPSRAAQSTPSHAAMLVAACPPACVKLPPTNSFPPG
jgi:hypothetical protein